MAKKGEQNLKEITKVWGVIQNYVSKLLGEERSNKVVSYLEHCWAGKEVLWKVFWLYGVVGLTSLSVLFVAPLALTGGRLAESIALLIIAPYVVWVLRSVWVSAENIELDEFKGIPKAYLTLVSKLVVVLTGINFFLALFA